ncbi:MAG: nucleoside monophosphate kinase [bacterium]|jgi:adenylate kinase|nr:nucleoside monophosphate kinase [bacterium]
MNYKILLMGPQGSGKGTQAELLSNKLNIPALSMGQLIRDEMGSGSEFAAKLKEIVTSGELISDKDAAHLLKQRLEKEDAQAGYILDGYPRNMSQFHAFDFDTPTHVMVIEIPRKESLKRLGGRLTCGACGKIGNTNEGLNPGDACKCGDSWTQREDDKPEAITRRLEIYEKDTAPVIEQYKDQVVHIDGLGTVEEILDRITNALN